MSKPDFAEALQRFRIKIKSRCTFNIIEYKSYLQLRLSVINKERRPISYFTAQEKNCFLFIRPFVSPLKRIIRVYIFQGKAYLLFASIYLDYSVYP